jgi:hypothetical protein
VTVATGTAVTVTAAVPTTRSTVAMIVALPGATAVTSPVADTVATAAALVVQATVRAVRVFPAVSLGVAVYCWVPPTARLAVLGVTVTAATGTAVTVTAAEPRSVKEPLPVDAVMVTGPPSFMPLTSPEDETTAVSVSLLDHLNVRPDTTLPLES